MRTGTLAHRGRARRRGQLKQESATQASKKAPCPVCGKGRSAAALLAAEEELQRRQPGQATRAAGWTVKAALRHRLRWACEACIAGRRALRGRPRFQSFCCDRPYFAYVDKAGQCRDCGNEFIFRASEQRFWYEQLKFVLSSHPVRCAPCRRALRGERRRNTELAEAVKTLDPDNPDQLAHISSLYLAMGLRSKAAAYLRRAKNRTALGAPWEALVRRIEEIESRPT